MKLKLLIKYDYTTKKDKKLFEQTMKTISKIEGVKISEVRKHVPLPKKNPF